MGDELAHPREDEADTNAIKGLIKTHVAGGWSSMQSAEDMETEAARDDDDNERGGFGVGGGAGKAEAVVGPEDALRTGWLAVDGRKGGEFSNGPWNRGRSVTDFSKEQTSTRIVRVLAKPGDGGGQRGIDEAGYRSRTEARQLRRCETGDMAEERNSAQRLGKEQARSWSRGNAEAEVGGNGFIAEQERIGKAPTGNGIDIFHHAAGAVDDGEIITEQFLTPTAEERTGTIVIKQRLKRDAIGDPVKVTTPESTAIATDTVAPRASLAGHRMVCGFGRGSFARAETGGAEAGPIHIKVEFAGVAVAFT